MNLPIIKRCRAAIKRWKSDADFIEALGGEAAQVAELMCFHEEAERQGHPCPQPNEFGLWLDFRWADFRCFVALVWWVLFQMPSTRWGIEKDTPFGEF